MNPYIYQVFECSNQDRFDYDPNRVLFEHPDLGICHAWAYEQFLADTTKSYVIMDPEHCGRGGYGAAFDDSLEETPAADVGYANHEDSNVRLMFAFLEQAQKYAAAGDMKMACASVRNAADFERSIPESIRLGD